MEFSNDPLTLSAMVDATRLPPVTALVLPCQQCRFPLLADCVEEVGGPTVWDVARDQARVSLFALRPALGRGAGSALPAFGGSGRW
ncbi:MAG: hypothetical protein Q7T29_11115, partial [Gallionella sp.]|nr:hypothetical protein [Gallionella sp.]